MKKLFILLLLVLLTGCDYLGVNEDIIITFVNGEEQTEKNFKDIGEFPILEKEGFSFLGWYLEETFETKFDISDVTESVTLYANWEVSKYTITFIDKDGFLIEEQILEYNEDIIAPSAPIVEGYTFTGWNLEFSKATSNLELVALYSMNKYKVVFLDNFGEVIKEEFVNYSESATAPIAPVIEHYTFKEWDKKFNNITGDLEVKSIYEKNKYTVTFKDYDGSVIKTEEVEYLSGATAPESPIRTGYTFSKWSEEIGEITNNTEVVAEYVINKYKVEFKDYNGVIISTQEVDYMGSAIRPSDPTRQDYTFAGWDSDFSKVTNDLVIYAVYLKGVTKISFNTDGGSSLSPIYVSSDTEYTLPVPTKSGSEFLRWTYKYKEVPLTGNANFTEDMTLQAVWQMNYVSSGTLVKYRNTSTNVLMPSVYTQKDEEFRGVWVSNLTSDISRYTSKEQMMGQLTTLLDNLESWNMNALVFHIRIMNDALYETNLSPVSPYMSNANFEEWDYLEWLIDESHKRGIEFHAWLNPYRIGSSTDINGVLDKYKNYPLNPASKAENIIVGQSGTILNPGEPAVRSFLIDTCMEVIEKYDVDAIHFDDYFYAKMNSSADITTYNKYKSNSSTTNIADWRREQVDIFIRDLSVEMRKYNSENARDVELGISPSGIYRNDSYSKGKVTYDENGTAITTGSNTSGMEHYGDYLYSDTKKWIDEEWIDYVCPQSYWGFTHPVAGYADVVDWWAKVVKYKNVKLYTGMGIYMTAYSWADNPYEASDQVLYNSKFNEINGVCIFRYRIFLDKLNDLGVKRILNEYWTTKVNVPK